MSEKGGLALEYMRASGHIPCEQLWQQTYHTLRKATLEIRLSCELVAQPTLKVPEAYAVVARAAHF